MDMLFEWELNETLYQNEYPLPPALLVAPAVRARNRQAEHESHPKHRRKPTALAALEELLTERLPIRPIRTEDLLDWDPEGEWAESRHERELQVLCAQKGIPWPPQIAL